MKSCSYLLRKLSWSSTVIAVTLLCMTSGPALPASGNGHPGLEHPFRNPQNYTEHKRCDNCGMDRNKWARTRHEFRTATGSFHTCSIACVALLTLKRKEEAANVQVAEYVHPETMLDAGKAVYVIGSSAKGTMTSISKIAFRDKTEAAAFVRKYGGRIIGLKDALAAARKEALGM